MVSALLDELPCLLDEADELMARLSCLKMLCNTPPPSAETNQDVVADDTGALRPRPSPVSSQLTGKTRSNAELGQALGGIDVDAVVKFFARQYLTMQAMSFDKVNANLPAGDAERSALHAVSASIYQLMKRLHHWQQAAWESLTRFFADSSSSDSCLLTFDSHPQLTRLVLATVAKYVKVNLLWASFRAIPGLLSLYSFLRHTQTIGDAVFSPLEHTDHRVREFVLHFGSAPLLAIQQDFQLQVADKGASLAALALSCFERYEACRDLAKLRHQGVFDLESLVSGAYASHPCLLDLLNNADVADWVICVVLCVPHQLQSGDRTWSLSPRSLPSSPSSPTNAPSFLQLWDFMEVVARDRLVLTLHRSHVVNLHDLLYQQVTSSLSAAALTTGTAPASAMSFGNSRSSTPLKKAMCALSKHALRNSGVRHRQRREVAAWLLRNCVQLLQHNPGLMAPSFPLLLAALAVARDEAEWIMCHGVHAGSVDGFKPPLLPSHVKAKHLQRVIASFSGAEKELADLLTSCHQLRGLLEQHSHFLAEYYQAFLVDGDAEGVAYTIRELFAANDSTTELQRLLESFLDSARFHVNTSPSPRVTWVREWRQANAHLATRPQLPLVDVLRARMECAVTHTQYVCVHAQLIEHAANFSKCWWFRDVVFDRCFEQALVTAPSAAVGLLAILSSLAEGDTILDELVDAEEATRQSERMLRRVDRMRASLVDQVGLGLEAVVKRDASLQRDETSGTQEESPEQLETKATASRRLSSFSRVQSSQVQRPSNAELRLASPASSVLTRNDSGNSHTDDLIERKPEQLADEVRYVELVGALLGHVGQDQHVSVLGNAIVQRVQSSFSRFLRGFAGFLGSTAAPRSIEGMMLRCSPRDACLQIRCFLRATERLFGGTSSGAVGIDDAPLGEALAAVLATALAAERSALVSKLPQDKRLLDWVSDAPRVSDKELLQWSLVDRVSWIFVSLVTRRSHPSAAAPVLASVRKGCFVLAPGVTGELDPRDYTDHGALQSLGALIGPAGVESVCSTIANLLVAQTLKLRSSIEAEHAVLAFMDMALSGNGSADVVLAAPQVRALDDMATQLVQIGTTVFLLQLVHDHSALATKDAWEARVASRVLRELQQDPDRRTTWARLLPVACCSAFHASVWRSTNYLSSVEATDSNAHLMGLAMARLLHSSQAVHRCAVAALKRASTCAGGSGPLSATRSKLPLPLGADPSARALLEALELLVTTATVSGAGHGSALGELELVVERLLPRAVVALHSAA